MTRIVRTPSQKGARVDEALKSLLSDPVINRFGPPSSTISSLCQRWGKEVAANPGAFSSEIRRLPYPEAAFVRIANVDTYTAYSLVDVREASKARLFTTVSMFAGGGGSSMGYRLAGGFIPLVNEFVPEAARTYRSNFPETRIDTRDIRDILADKGGIEAFLRQVNLAPGELDILDGSPPCSEFSVAGKGIRDQDIMRPYSDLQQKGIATLPFEFIELAVKARPKVVVCENVPALASGYPEVLGNILKELCFPDGKNGERLYYATSMVLNAEDFGVPQRRRRLFIIGVRADVAGAIGINSDRDVLAVFPIATHSPISIRAAIAGLRQSSFDVDPWYQTAVRSRSLISAIRRLPKCPHKHTRLSHVTPGDYSKFTLTRCSWDLPAPTLVVSGQRADGMTGAIHPEKDRKFTLPELRRLFGLPDDYVLTGTLSQASERICRMVPPLLTKAIAESIYEKVLRPYAEAMQ